MKPACRYCCIWQCRAEAQRTTSSQVEMRDAIRVGRLATHWSEGCDLRFVVCDGDLKYLGFDYIMWDAGSWEI